MSMDERSLGAPIPDRAHELRPTPELRWCDGKLQQAWRPAFGGQMEWRDVPSVTAHGVKECWACNGTRVVTTSSNGSGLIEAPCANCTDSVGKVPEPSHTHDCKQYADSIGRCMLCRNDVPAAGVAPTQAPLRYRWDTDLDVMVGPVPDGEWVRWADVADGVAPSDGGQRHDR